MFWIVYCRIGFCVVFLFVVCCYCGLLRFLLLWNVKFCKLWILIYSDELLTVISGGIQDCAFFSVPFIRVLI